MKKKTEVNDNKTERWKGRWSVVSCLLTVIITGLYTLEIWKRLNLTVVNVLCIPLFFSELRLGIVEYKNKKKAQLYLAAVFIGTVIDGLNLWTDRHLLEDFHISKLSVWSIVWGVLLIIAILFLVVILIRLMKWSQEKWEEWQEQRQIRRIESKNFWIKYIHTVNEHRMDMQEMKQAHKKEKLKIKAEKKKDEVKRKEQRAEIKFTKKIERDREKRPVNYGSILNAEKETIKKIISYKHILVRATLCIIFLIGFILLPYIDKGGIHTSGWLNNVEGLVRIIRDDSSFESQQEIILYYLFFYIFAASIILIIIYLIFRIVAPGDGTSTKDGDFRFIATYQEPIAILIVMGAAFYVITNGELDTGKLDQSWKCLLFIILMALVIFAAIEMVRIVLDQCSHSDSLLRKVIYLIFVAVLKVLSEILLGVIINIRIQQFINSIFKLVFPDLDPVEDRINSKLKQLFNDEISKVENEDKAQAVLKICHRHQIWRKHR